jgi:formylglycine-generating enzyme
MLLSVTLLGLLPLCAAATGSDGNPFLRVTGTEFQSVLPGSKQDKVVVHAFRLQRHPITNAEFLDFVKTHAQWQRGSVPAVLADAGYLGHWASPVDLGPRAEPQQPVTRVSWFAAEAYCEAQQARLPNWYEWELAAAASGSKRDARADAAWRQQILDWYARPAGESPADVERGSVNIWGVHDMHGPVWEWVHDFDSLMPADADPERFCGSGAQNVQQKENYPVLMRIAMLGSLHAADTGRSVGFRCARDAEGAP